MNRRKAQSVSWVWILAVLVAVFGVVLNVPVVRAIGTVYIRADGSIDPPDAPISTVDYVTYTLTGNITSDADGIVVERSNIVVDAAGYAVQGAETGTGFSLAADNVTVRNTCVQKFRYGIVISSSGCTIIDNVITYNVKWGVYLGGSNNKIIRNRIDNTGLNLVGYDIVGIYCGYGSDNNTIADNHIEKNGYVGSGILLYHSSDNAITGNNITNHDYAGIYLDTSSGNIIYHNSFISNYYQVYGSYSANTWDDGYPSGGNYWSNYADVDLKSGLYQNETGSDEIGDTPYNQDNYPLMRRYVPFENQTIYIRSDGSIDPSGAPIQRKGDLYTLTGNVISGSDGIVIEKDNIALDGAGYTVEGRGVEYSEGARLLGINNLTIKNTNIRNFFYGIWLDSCSDNSISGNNITANNNFNGIALWSAYNNLIYHNNFVDDPSQVYSYDSENVFDDGYPSGGNYWSDYTGVDLCNGPFQNLTGSDGIGDTPHAIDGPWFIDDYPLMAPISFFDAGTWNDMTYYVDIVSNSTVSRFHFNPQGGLYLEFNVTGQEGTVGFCRVAIPKNLLWAEDGQWIVLVGGVPITNYTITSHGNCTYLCFNYNHSTLAVVIQGTHVIPQFPSSLALPIFMIATLIAVIAYRRRQRRLDQWSRASGFRIDTTS